MQTLNALPLASRLSCQLARCALAVFLVVVLAAIPGCPGGPPSVANLVTGKVTYQGKKVDGIVKFIGADGKEAGAPILNGEYSLANPPLGKVKITVTGSAPMPGGAAGGVPPPAADALTKDVKDAKPNTGASTKMEMGVPPPTKYAQPDNGLTYEVKGGKETKDLPLTD